MSSIRTVGVSLGCRAIQVSCSVLVVRYLVNQLGLSGYGVWVTLTAAAVWMSLFDFGVGYGIKNRLSELHATGNVKLFREMASIGVVFYTAASVAIAAAFLAVILFVEPFSGNRLASLILFGGATFTFFSSLGGIIMQGVGSFQVFYGLSIIGPILWAGAVLLNHNQKWSVTEAAVFFVISNCIQALAVVFVGKSMVGKLVIPAFSRILEVVGPLFRVGSGFLISQLSNIALFLSGNFIVYRSLGAEEATKYDTTNKLFQFLIVGFSILVNISWTRISQCKALENFKASKKIYWSLLMSAIASGVAALGLALVAQELIALLTKGRVVIELSSALMFVPLIFVQTLAYSGSVFLNAYEELRVQNILSVASIPLFFLIVTAFLKFGFGSGSIPMASAASVVPSMLYCLWRGHRLSIEGAKC